MWLSLDFRGSLFICLLYVFPFSGFSGALKCDNVPCRSIFICSADPQCALSVWEFMAFNREQFLILCFLICFFLYSFWNSVYLNVGLYKPIQVLLKNLFTLRSRRYPQLLFQLLLSFSAILLHPIFNFQESLSACFFFICVSWMQFVLISRGFFESWVYWDVYMQKKKKSCY